MWYIYWYSSPIDSQIILAYGIYVAFKGIFDPSTYFAVVWQINFVVIHF